MDILEIHSLTPTELIELIGETISYSYLSNEFKKIDIHEREIIYLIIPEFKSKAELIVNETSGLINKLILLSKAYNLYGKQFKDWFISRNPSLSEEIPLLIINNVKGREKLYRHLAIKEWRWSPLVK